MPTRCPHCQLENPRGLSFVCYGFYFRTDDSRWIQRYRCRRCRRTCSKDTGGRWFRSKKRRHHEWLRRHFASLGAIRRGAYNLRLNRKTIARKLVILGEVAEENLRAGNLLHEKARVVQFDDLETFEHTKCKPISITLAVQNRTRRILGLEIASMPAKGPLAEKSRELYGFRADDRPEARTLLFNRLKELVHEEAEFCSDMNPAYPNVVKEHFPKANHITFLSRRGSLGGGGELKQGGFDPLFSLNHTCASFRMNVTRLLRKTWYTTKRPDRLRAHLFLYADFHNTKLEDK